jgi:hypothetical protein
MLLSKLIDDILLRVSGGSPSDDMQIEREQVGHWLSVNRDMLVKAKLDDDIKNGRQLDSFYIEREVYKIPDLEATEGIEDPEENIYITLTKKPLSLFKDSAIINVWTEEYLPVYKSRIENFSWVQDLKYAKPDLKHLVYYRLNDKLIIKGLNYKNLDTDNFIVDYIPSAADQELSESDDLPITDDLLPMLLEMTEDIARRELFGVQDQMNDGVPPTPQNQLDIDKLKENK